jgi:ABC-type transport system involved in multi-copper enzyme maturation permease subunit
MSFLPIVERELRVAARRPATHWTRFCAALATLTIWLLLALSTPQSVPVPQLSKNLFIATGLLAFGFCVLAGVFLTADCLSVEKREGTLGLLFLTDLKSHDIVFGKLAATSMHSLYGLLAIFPVMALPLLLGGVTGSEFGRVLLVVLTTLFLSLVLGMFVSAISREARSAIGGTFLFLLLLAGMFPGLWLAQEMIFRANPTGDALLLPSPGYTFRLALDDSYRTRTGPMQFLGSLSLLTVLGLGCLTLAIVLLPRRWQDKDETVGAPEHPASRLRIRRLIRVPLLDANPFCWLASRGGPTNVLLRVTVVVAILLWTTFYFGSFNRRMSDQAFAGAVFSSYGLHVLLKCFIAMRAVRRLSEDRLSGALELLLVSPLQPRDILSGQRRALRRFFRAPTAWLVLLNAALIFLIHYSAGLSMGSSDRRIFTGIFLGGILALFADSFALSWIGIEMGLRGKRQPRAVLATLGRVLLPNWLGAFVLVFVAQSGKGITHSEGDILITSWFLLGLGIDLVLGLRAKRRLQRRFREIASGPLSKEGKAQRADSTAALGFGHRPLNSAQP